MALSDPAGRGLDDHVVFRKVRFVDQARDLRDVDPRTLARKDIDLAELLESVQSAAELLVLKEAAGVKVYEVKRLKPAQLFLRPEHVRVWTTSDAHRVTCFAVELSADRGRNYMNPMDLLP